MSGAQHSSASNEHYTPHKIVEAARVALGAFDLDPASCEVANEIIKAAAIYTEADDGISRQWTGRVFLNPPGGKTKNKSNQAAWWHHLAAAYLQRKIHSAIYVAFSIEVFQTAQTKNPAGLPLPQDFPFCCPNRRLSFLSEDETGALRPGGSNTHASAIILLPYSPQQIARFETAFAGIGKVTLPSQWTTKTGESPRPTPAEVRAS